MGEFILLVDCDTVVPEDCLRDAVREFNEPSANGEGGEDGREGGGEKVGIIQHESDVMQVVGHWFENGVAYFTRRVNRCISMGEFLSFPSSDYIHASWD
jgi:cellulose synthase/poly-beta-1,6-N-acetylglucosamine synthase-like glycosyltransferase